MESTPADTADDVRSRVRTPPGPSGYVYTWLKLDKAGALLPYQINGDSERVMIGVYNGQPAFACTLTPALSQDGACITAVGSSSNVELRVSTHGTCVQDSWTLDGDPGAVVTLLLVTREGG